jgi:PAS domain S-box-containing protein
MYSAQKSKAATFTSLLSIIVGVVVMIGWLFKIIMLRRFFPQFAFMMFNTALCFILLSAIILIAQLRVNKFTKIIGVVLSVTVMLFALVSVSQYVFSYSAGMDQLFITDWVSKLDKYPLPGRMAVNVSACFALFGLAMLGFAVKNKLVNIIAQYCLHLVTAISTVALFGYLYGIPFFYNPTYIGSMAPHTAVLLFLLSYTAALLHPSLGVAGLFTGNLVGNKMARRIFLLIVLMVMVFGELRTWLQHAYKFPIELGVSLHSICFLTVSLFIISYTANWLNRIDVKRYEAEQKVKSMNEELERRVEERSAELMDLLDRYRESESKFRTAFEFSAIGMALISPEGNWLQLNKRLCELLGYTEAELISMTVMEITYPADMAATIAALKIALSKGNAPRRIEKRYLNKNGSIIWASVNLATVTDDNGAPLYVVTQVEDITLRKKIDARFRAIVESVFVGIKLTDANGHLIYRSPSMQAINGWTDEEMGNNYFELIHPDDLEMVKNARLEVLASPGKYVNVVFRLLHKNGGYIWIESLLSNKLYDPELSAVITVTREITERKVVEDRLKKSEAKYHSLIEHASDAIYLLDLSGYFVDVNESMCKMSGYTKCELLNLDVLAIIDPEDLEANPINLGPFDASVSVIRERRMVRKDGVKFDVEINVKAFDGDKILVIARDITDRKRMENDLREAEIKFRTIAEKSMVGVYISQQERFVYVNPRFAEIFGYEQHELINSAESGIEMLISECDRQSVRANLQARYKGEMDNINYEVKGRRKDGSSNNIEFYGSRVILNGEPSVIGTMLDVTERRKAEKVLKRSEANLKTIMDTTDTAYALMDKRLRVIAFNQMAVKFVNSLSGHMPVIGDRLPDYFTEEGFPHFIAYADIVLKGQSISYEINYPQADGLVVWYYVRLFPIMNENNEIFGLMLALSDISERKNAEDNLKNAYKAVQEHIDSIQDMAWKQSHLIRSPVANLKGLSVLLNEDPLDSEVLEFMNIELERLDKVIIEMAKDASNHGI